MKAEHIENPFEGRKYIRAIGRRKSAVASVKLFTGGKGVFLVNHTKMPEYFGNISFSEFLSAPLVLLGKEKEFDISAKISGGGKKGQAEAIRLALSRALVKHEDQSKPTLRKAGYVTVDSRVKERKKPGLKRARRSPQWSKR